MNIYEINTELQGRLVALGELLENDIEPSNEEIATLLDLKQDLDDKLKAYGKVITNTNSDIDGLDSEIKRLTAHKRRLVKLVERLTDTMQFVMNENNITQIDDPIMPIRIVNNPPSVRIDIDVEHLPKEYIKTSYTADKTALAKALKSGVLIDGVSIESKQRVRIG